MIKPPKKRLIGVAGLVLASTTVLAGCTTSTEPTVSATGATGVPDGVVELPVQEWSHVDENTTLGDSDETIPSSDDIPQGLHVGKIDPITEDDIVIIGDGGLEYSMQVVDPATGTAKTKIVTGPGIWDPVIHPFVGKTPDDPAVLAAEVWRPRGSRGAADYTISTYSGTMLEPKELLMPDYTRLHSRWGSSIVTDDGRYFVSWDDALYGVRVFDLEEGKETGAMALLGCGPFTWAVGRDVYSVCENSRELLELTIQDDGSIEETGRETVLPDDFVSNRHSSFGFDSDAALLVGANGDVYVFDLSDGLPADEVRPIGNAGQEGGRFDAAFINNPGTSIAIGYTDSVIHPDSTDGGETATIILSDPSTFATVGTLTKESTGLTTIDGFGYSVDGATLYVQGKAGEGDAAERTLIGYDAASAAETTRVTVPDFVGDAGRILTPQVTG
jgi:hypothetical protein